MEAERIFKELMDRLRTLKEGLKDFSPIIHIEMSTRDMEPLLIDIISAQ